MGTALALIGVLASLFVLALLIDQAKREELIDKALSDDYMPFDTNADVVNKDEAFDDRLLTKRDDNE